MTSIGIKYEVGRAMLGYQDENYLLRIDLDPTPTAHLGHGVKDRWTTEDGIMYLELSADWMNGTIAVTKDSTFGLRGHDPIPVLPLVEKLLALPPGTTIPLLETP